MPSACKVTSDRVNEPEDFHRLGNGRRTGHDNAQVMNGFQFISRCEAFPPLAPVVLHSTRRQQFERWPLSALFVPIRLVPIAQMKRMSLRPEDGSFLIRPSQEKGNFFEDLIETNERLLANQAKEISSSVRLISTDPISCLLHETSSLLRHFRSVDFQYLLLIYISLRSCRILGKGQPIDPANCSLMIWNVRRLWVRAEV